MAKQDRPWARLKARTVGVFTGRRGAKPLAVSVVINTLNRCEHLERTLLALREQSYEAFEVIVVNGPSVDGTEAMLGAFSDSARLATCDVASLGRSRNVGVEVASGEVVAFIDDDAIPSADWLETLLAPYRDPAIAAVGGPVFDVPLDCVAWTLCTCSRLGVPNTNSDGPIDRYLGVGADPLAYLPGCNMSFRRDVLAEIGGFNSLLSYNYDDAEICSRVIDAGYRIEMVDDVLVRHDRAPNVARDGRDMVLDPYHALYCRAVFTMQCRQPKPRAQEISAVLHAAADDTVGLADSYLAGGLLTQAERDAFIARAKCAVEEGLTVGSAPRPKVPFAPADPVQFRSYT